MYDLESFSGMIVDNLSEVVETVLVSATLASDGLTLVWLFSQPVSGDAVAGFSLTGASIESGITAGNTVIHTLAEPVIGGAELTGSYSSATGTLNTDGRDVPSFGPVEIDNQSEQVPAPVLLSVTILSSGTAQELVFDRPIVSGSATAGFSRSLGSITSGSIDGAIITQVIPKVFQGDSGGTLSYDSGAGSIAGQTFDVASFGPVAVTNNSTQVRVPPTMTAASVAANGTSVTLTFSEAISGNPALGFTMTVNAGAATLTGGAISGSQITYTAGATIYSGQTVLLSYNSATGDIAGAEADLASLTDAAVTNNSTQAQAAISQVGPGLTITNNASPRLAVLTSSLFAYHDASSDQLRAYSANTETGAVALSGSGLSVACTYSSIVGMGANWIATHIHTGTSGSLRRHNWGGSSWSQASTTANSNLDPVVIKVNATTVVVRGGQEGGTYVWSGSNFTLLTSNVPGSGASSRFGCYLQDNQIALFSPTTGGYNLETWALSGVTWSQVGNTLFVAISSGLGRSNVTALSSTRIVTYWGGATGGRMARIFDFNGTDWAQVGAGTQIGSATASQGAVAALGANHFVHIDDVDDTFRIFSVT